MKYEFELSEPEKERLFTALKSVRLGDSIDAVKQKLGNPTREKRRSTKTGGSPGYFLEYFVKHVDMAVHNVNDHNIGLSFNVDKKLEDIVYSCMEPFFGELIPDAGWPEMQVYVTKPPAI